MAFDVIVAHAAREGLYIRLGKLVFGIQKWPAIYRFLVCALHNEANLHMPNIKTF